MLYYFHMINLKCVVMEMTDMAESVVEMTWSNVQ